MNLHEYQAKKLLAAFGLPIGRGFLAYSAKEAQKAAVNLGGGTVVVKAQVHAGGRGKAGGVKLAKSPEQARAAAEAILGMKLISPQTGPAGKLVRKVWVEEGASIKSEYYLSFVVDRKTKGVSLIASAEGGVEIEEVAKNQPEKILTLPISYSSGYLPSHGRELSKFLDLDKDASKQMGKLSGDLYRAFLDLDCSLLEINPLILTDEGKLVCLDAKMAIDDNALFRQREAFEMLDYDEVDDREIRSAEVGISYVAMEGNIGCMVNGAGLAMGTMDMIKLCGGEPANFLDVGGGASAEMVKEAFSIILKDPAVKGVMVNIFGGIMRCDVIAEGIIQAAKELSVEVPLVVRLAGNNVERGKELLAGSGLRITPANDMEDAAKKIVAAIS